VLRKVDIILASQITAKTRAVMVVQTGDCNAQIFSNKLKRSFGIVESWTGISDFLTD